MVFPIYTNLQAIHNNTCCFLTHPNTGDIMTKEELKKDITIYLHLHPDEDYTFEELFKIAKRLPEPYYKMFIKRYGHLTEELLG
jgi:hypothetical protein